MTQLVASKKIGIFDSGIGGFSIVREIFQLLPDHQIYYIADEAKAPYGAIASANLQKRCQQITQLLLNHAKIELIVIACNSATAASINHLRETFPKITFVGVEPYLNIQNNISFDKKNQVAVILTESTAKSTKFLDLKKRVDPENRIKTFITANLAEICEQIFHKGINEQRTLAVATELKPLRDHNFTHLILGCTHYPLITSLIEKITNVKCISPSPHIAKQVRASLGPITFNKNLTIDFFWFNSTKKNQWEQFLKDKLFTGRRGTTG